jgi:glutaredoxin
VLTLYQAEWCPYSSAVRQLLTELGLDFVARQVPPTPELRSAMRERTGSDGIPLLETPDGQFIQGTRPIIEHLRGLPAWEHAAAHRERYREHRNDREKGKTERIVEEERPAGAAAEDGRDAPR